MNERIKELRLSLGLTLDAFGERIGIGKSSVSKIEKGINGTTDQTIKSICREFNVDEHWLRTGEGDMFQQDSQSIIDRLTTEYDLSNRDRAVVSAFLELSAEDRAAITRYIDRLVSKFASNTSTDLDIDAETEAYRRELEAQKKEEEKSSASDMPSAKEA